MSIFLNADSKVIVQGMTGSEGMKHTQRMLRSGTNIVGGVNPRKAGTKVEFEDGVTVPENGSRMNISVPLPRSSPPVPAGVGRSFCAMAATFGADSPLRLT